jgi:hypothetical protein
MNRFFDQYCSNSICIYFPFPARLVVVSLLSSFPANVPHSFVVSIPCFLGVVFCPEKNRLQFGATEFVCGLSQSEIGAPGLLCTAISTT